jgi:hypothetical protein
MFPPINKLRLITVLFLFSFILSGQLMFSSNPIYTDSLDDKVNDLNETQLSSVEDNFLPEFSDLQVKIMIL